MNPARIVFGQVMHRRLRPARHRFAYPVFFLLLPLQRLDEVAAPLFSVNRANLFSFRFADHGARDGSPPLPWIRALLAREGIVADGEVWLQAFPRMLGYVFNPVSFWYCHDRAGRLAAVLAEVRNTFGERHNYLIAHADGSPIRDGETLEARKVFHVSPFMAVQGHYRFRFHAQPGDARILARIDHADAGGDLLHTAISGRAVPITAPHLLRAFFGYPWMTLGVMARIHWQALLLWLKRVPFHSKPRPPFEETTR
ncbi:MAG: DUF1365 domain-containing protein [Rhodocyclaceae bacterium]|nr:DUF1365 domain-containing protein [Rhodocyclaceae bacterium]